MLRLVVLGDSIAVPAVGCGDCTGFDELYADYLTTLTGRPVDLRNEAVPAAQIEDLQSLLDSNTAVQGAIAKADIVVVSIGYNNGPPWGPDDPCHVQEVARDADLILAILAMTPECITATIEKYRGELDAAYGRIEELAAGRRQVRITFGVFDNIRDNPGGDGTLPQVPSEDMQPAIELFGSDHRPLEWDGLRGGDGARFRLRGPAPRVQRPGWRPVGRRLHGSRLGPPE